LKRSSDRKKKAKEKLRSKKGKNKKKKKLLRATLDLKQQARKYQKKIKKIVKLRNTSDPTKLSYLWFASAQRQKAKQASSNPVTTPSRQQQKQASKPSLRLSVARSLAGAVLRPERHRRCTFAPDVFGVLNEFGTPF
jgi:hypothetical protein